MSTTKPAAWAAAKIARLARQNPTSARANIGRRWSARRDNRPDHDGVKSQAPKEGLGRAARADA
eukprot:4127496-Alexandrium_andersonii.AAC.1